jgi:hypothetical protein
LFGFDPLTSLSDRALYDLLGCLQELLLLELQLSLQLFPLDVRDKEGGNEVLDKGLRLVSSLLYPVQEVI